VLDQLVELFLAEGFSRFTIADIARRLRCSKSTLYALGPSKEQVTVNAVVHFFRRPTQRVEDAIARFDDPGERLAAYLNAVAAALRPATLRFITDVSANPATNAVYAQNTDAAARRVSQIIDDGIRTGSFRPAHGPFVADVVATIMRRIQTGHIWETTGLRDADAYDELARLVLHGLDRG